jgi:hypothetical protein
MTPPPTLSAGDYASGDAGMTGDPRASQWKGRRRKSEARVPEGRSRNAVVGTAYYGISAIPVLLEVQK